MRRGRAGHVVGRHVGRHAHVGRHVGRHAGHHGLLLHHDLGGARLVVRVHLVHTCVLLLGVKGWSTGMSSLRRIGLEP